MKESDLLTINLNIFEKQLPLRLTIPRDKEETYRKAADLINTAIKEYRKQYQVIPLESILSMVSLNFAVKSLTSANDKDMQPLLDELNVMDAGLKSYLDTQVSD
jgi:cell division protein ZapA (FtsZ GTPase activity inhibitor)